MPFRITTDCTGCTACERRCPTAAITGTRGQLFVIDPKLCIDCGACGVVCPDAAILDAEGTLCQMLKAAQRPKAFVEPDKCTGCVYCVNACPFDCITMEPAPPGLAGSGGMAATIAVVEMKKCTGCTLCEIDCPYDAIHILRQDDARARAILERARAHAAA